MASNLNALRRVETIAGQLVQCNTNDTSISSQPTATYPKPQNDYEVIIIGGGVHGTATADALSKRGKKVLLLEQFDVNHEEGSSHGDGRIIRYSYPETYYIELAKITYPLWEDLEKRCGTKLTFTTGGIDFGSQKNLDDLCSGLKQRKIPFEVLTAEQANKRFPMYKIPAGTKVVYQKDSGVAFASKAVKAMWDLAQQQGATILPRHKVVSVKVVNDAQVAVEVQGGERFTADKLVVTAGAWAKDLLAQLNLDLPLKVTQEQVFYWKEKKNIKPSHSMHHMPVFIVHGDQNFYGLPQVDIPGVKIGWHHSGHEIDINDRKVNSTISSKQEQEVSNFVSKVFPDLEHERPSHKLFCLYTTTPDGHFIIDYHPTHKNVIIGSPCSGHGFKFGPAVGELLARMALGEKLPISLKEFKIERFARGVTKRTGV